jgi:hypothetical protein
MERGTVCGVKEQCFSTGERRRVEMNRYAVRYRLRMVTQALAPLPMTWQRPVLAPSTWRTPAVPRSWRTISTTCPRAEAPRG